MEYFDYVKQLFAEFGWWSIALVVAITLTMIPINLLIKKIFSKAEKDSVTRIRKTLAQLMVFVLSAVYIVIFCLIFKMPLDVNFILANVVPSGVCAMLVWAVIKIVMDLGLKNVFTLIANSKVVKDLLKKIPLDEDVKNTIYNHLLELINNTDGDNAEVVKTKQDELTLRATQMLQGFVENPTEIANQIVAVLKEKFK